MKKGQYGARQNKIFDIEKFDSIRLINTIGIEDEVLKESVNKFDNLYRTLNFSVKAGGLDDLVLTLNQDNVENYLSKFISDLKEILDKKTFTFLSHHEQVFTFDNDYKLVKYDFNEEEKKFLKKEFAEDYLAVIEDIILVFSAVLLTFRYVIELQNTNKEFVGKFDSQLIETREFLKSMSSFLIYDDFTEENDIESVLLDLIPFFQNVIGDFGTFLYKYQIKPIEKNLKQVVKNYKKTMDSSEKIESREEIQSEFNINLTDYYRVAVLQDYFPTSKLEVRSESKQKRNEIAYKEFLVSILDESSNIFKELRKFNSEEKIKIIKLADESCDDLLKNGVEKFGYEIAFQKYVERAKMTKRLLYICFADEDIDVSNIAKDTFKEMLIRTSEVMTEDEMRENGMI
ncbi:hypothetical protein [Poseidonibacter ostreae]|uniref:Uncharacterized protein n=1 Tax=Poseidonibacter ostreae TaxID=2654171 RepID=A0A6L4WTH5_9BACT|nr:hypothetical protein [Poseidonibacter ostreae]KAB7889579.1 hypothetical protein GBG19_05850 [Poseidonibacter ostreae]